MSFFSGRPRWARVRRRSGAFDAGFRRGIDTAEPTRLGCAGRPVARDRSAPAASDPAPADPAPSDPPATDAPATIDTPASETTTPPPTNTNDQNANATTTGTAVADTGSNTAASGTNSNVAGSVGGSTNPSANAGATSGTAGATGSQDTTQVDQIATATTNGQGAVDILQVALVINLGVSNGQSGANTAIAAGGPGGAGGDAQGAIDTGNASAVGNRATTTVTQAAVVAGGDASSQITAVLNIGIGVGNTGLNVAMGNITVDGISAAQLTLLNSGTAAVQSGNADALGNRSDTRVLQSATGTASGTAVLQIGQWAIVLNFGTAFANTGGNAAVAGTGPGGMGPAEYQAVLAIMNVLGPILDGLGTPTGSTVGNSSAVILTGDAAALGNDASTTIAQTAAGAVSGSQYTSANQRATVANLGLALANTGYNASLANPGAIDLASLGPATSQLSQFFGLLTDTSWLTSAEPVRIVRPVRRRRRPHVVARRRHLRHPVPPRLGRRARARRRTDHAGRPRPSDQRRPQHRDRARGLGREHLARARVGCEHHDLRPTCRRCSARCRRPRAVPRSTARRSLASPPATRPRSARTRS